MGLTTRNQQFNLISIFPYYLSLYELRISGVMWICFLAGVDKVVSSSSPPSFLLTRHGGIFGQLMAEYVVAQMVNWERRLYNTYDDQKKRRWWVELGGEIMYTALHLWEGAY